MKRIKVHKNQDGTKTILVEEEIFDETKNTPFMWKDLKHIQFQDDDVLYIRYEEGFYSENNSQEEKFVATVLRYRPETEEERKERIEKDTIVKERLKRQRYNRYLALKAEFEKN